MKKLALSLAIISALGLSACGSESIEDVQQEVKDNGSAVMPLARIVFDPSNGVLSVPNDLLFSGSPDGTLHMPIKRDDEGNIISGEKDEEGNEIESPNYAEPSTAMGAIDGWSTTNPFVLAIDFPVGTSLDGSSVVNPASVKIFETLMGGDPGCEEVPRGAACTVVGELTFGVDFAAQASGNSIAIIPLKPLKAKTTYILALTNNLKDSNGTAIAGSGTYEAVRQDLTTNPLATDDQKSLQGVINSYENAIVVAGADKDALIYTMALTTQSTTDVLATAKALMANNVPAMVANAMKGIPTIGVQDTGMSVANILAPYPEGHPDFDKNKIPQSLVPLYSTANFMQGSITLPYYSGVPSVENGMAPVNDWWKSLCDSGAILAGVAAKIAAGELPAETIPAEPISVDDGTCMAISAAKELPAPGLRSLGFDAKRHLTKFSPVPKANTNMPVVVQMTTPDVNVANAVRPGLNLPADLVQPDSGWPVVILQHGITSKKEDMLAITGILSAYGFATVAINHPLHGDPDALGGLLPGGSRGFDITGPDGIPDGIDDINASTVSATHYMNLASLLTTRDNLRQSTSDLVGLRLGLNFLGGLHTEGNPIKVDGSNVHFLGHSLGAITGINFVALTNSALDAQVDPLFAVKTNTQAMPGVMIANLLMESGSFGNLIKANLTYSASPEFKAMVDAMYPLDANGRTTATEKEMVAAYLAFYAALTAEQQAGLNATFTQFVFAAQTVTDAGDPANYANIIKVNGTPTHLIEVVGNGVDSDGGVCKDILATDNCSDQVVPNRVTTTPFGGTEGAITLLGLPIVSSDTEGSGAVRFMYGHHGSILDPVPNSVSVQDPLITGAVTQEMQGQVVGFFATMGQLIKVTNTEVIK
ncbi:VolA/Pla-1 family phospholipase [Colwellia psychrerythraea]|uniref:Extracellular lipase, Pla-1/cef family n=1 Tax=Colwellia psychrerythraea TaxID=28229 RepID=A0A099KMX1_COLPS|nr:VolA/Pla-1 family phospholipase [Colwellia psychrerythraea]KGJ91826.1 extracellular lipase, Pla-1/cef family [Colwellia psychrerythraea]